MPKEDRAKAAEKKRKEEEKRVETATRENKNIFRRIFDRLPEGVKNFIRGIRDVVVTAVNRIAFGKEGNRKVQNYAANEYIKRLKEEEELNSGEKGAGDKGAPNTPEGRKEEEIGIETGEVAEDITELEGIEEAAEDALEESEEIIIPPVRFATLTDLKELDKSLDDTGPKRELKEGKGPNSHIFYYKDNGEELARISLCLSTENVPPEKVFRADNYDQTKVVELYRNGEREFYSLAGATAYVKELIELERAQEARLPEFGLYKGLQERLADRTQSEIVDIDGKYHLYLYATDDHSVAPYAAVSITNPKGALSGAECLYKVTRPNEISKEYSDIYQGGKVRFNNEEIGEEIERVRNAYEERTKEKEEPEASAEKQTEEKTVAQQTQSGQMPDTPEVTRIVAYNKAAYDKALTRALETHQDLDIKLASTDVYIRVRNGEVINNDQREKAEKTEWESDAKSFTNVAKSKIEAFYKGKEMTDSFAYGDYQVDLGRVENIATISFTAGGETRTFILDDKSKKVLKNEIASAISKGEEWMSEKVAGAEEVKYEGAKDASDKSAIENEGKPADIDTEIANATEIAGTQPVSAGAPEIPLDEEYTTSDIRG